MKNETCESMRMFGKPPYNKHLKDYEAMLFDHYVLSMRYAMMSYFQPKMSFWQKIVWFFKRTHQDILYEMKHGLGL